jgi:hypothetical protein
MFISVMLDSVEMRHLQKFTPFKTEAGPFGYDIYGCGEVPGRGEVFAPGDLSQLLNLR